MRETHKGQVPQYLYSYSTVVLPEIFAMSDVEARFQILGGATIELSEQKANSQPASQTETPHFSPFEQAGKNDAQAVR